MTEQIERTPVAAAMPLARAADRLGISQDALRMRVHRGKAEGFKRGGRLFVYVNGNTNNVRLSTGGVAEADEHDLAAIVELQRIELSRLLRENDRLSRRTDRLMNLYEREQVLRHQMQKTIDRLSRQPGGSGSAGAAADAADDLARLKAQVETRLKRAEDQAARLKQVVGRLIRFLNQEGDPS